MLVLFAGTCFLEWGGVTESVHRAELGVCEELENEHGPLLFLDQVFGGAMVRSCERR